MLVFNSDHYHQLHEALSSDKVLRRAYELCLQHRKDSLWGFTANILIECMLCGVTKPPQPPYVTLRDWAVSRVSLQYIKENFIIEQCKREGRNSFEQIRGFFENLSHAIYMELTMPVSDHNHGLPFFKDIGGRYQVIDDADPDLTYILRQRSEGEPAGVFTACPTWAEKLFISPQIYEVFKNLARAPWASTDADEVFKSALTLYLRHRHSEIVGSDFGGVQDDAPRVSENRQPIDDRLETSYLNIIGALLEVIAGEVPGWEKHPNVASEAQLIEKLATHYRDIRGMSQRNLQHKFPKAKRSVRSF